jgi:hypothetical protein
MDGEVIIGVGADTKSFDNQIKTTEQKLEQLEDEFKSLSTTKPYANQEEDLRNLSVEIEKTKNKLVDLNKKQMDLSKIDIKQTQSSFEGISNSITGIIKKTAKWAVAVFGIRGAYSAVRKAVSVLTQYDKQLSTDIEYIQFALASTLKPIVEWIVKAIYTILGYIGSLVQSITGVNIFANASAKAFNKSTKEAKKLKKELTGIDKITKLSSSDSGASNGGTKTPSMDLSKINTKLDFKSALNSINNFIDGAKEIFNTGFETIKKNVMKVLMDLGFSENFIKFWGTMMDGIKQEVNGALEFIKGLLNVFIGFISGDTEAVKKGISSMIDGIKQMVIGHITYLIGLIGSIGSLILDLLGKILDWIASYTRKFGAKIGEWGKNTWNGIKNTFAGIPGFFAGIFNKVKTFLVDVGSKAGSIVGDAFKGTINAVLKAIESILNTPIKAINKMIDSVNKLPGVNLGKMDTFNLPRLAKGGIINNPGRGVMVGGAIGGERGAEWVQPLTDTQMLEKVGQAIGRHIKNSVDLSVQLDSRTIARVLKEIDNEKKFALNGG